jgi:hypothetical protein
MRVAGRAISGLGAFGDFVNGRYALPQNPVSDAGMGDFVKGWYAVPQNPVLGLNGIGDCSCGGSCGPCKSGRGTSGLGQTSDYSLTGTAIGIDIDTPLGLTLFENIPNYVFYGVGALAIYLMFFETQSRPRYQRR